MSDTQVQEERIINLDAQQYEDFIRTISLLRDLCSDVDIRDGVIRQRSDDHSCIFEIDISNIISDSPGAFNLNIPLTNIRQKIDLLKCFLNEIVEIKVNSSSFSFSDSQTILKFANPNLEFMDNKFMSQEELDSIFVLDGQSPILELDIKESFSNRISIISKSFNMNSLQLLFNGEFADLVTETQSKDQFAKLIGNIHVETDVSIENSYSNLVVIPFIIDHDGDIKFNMFRERENICISRFNTCINNVGVNVFIRSSIDTLE